MSLDVYLYLEGVQKLDDDKVVPIRENGQNMLITRAEWYARYPNREPICIETQLDDNEVYSGNITHNLGGMADEAGIYQYLWRPDELNIEKAAELIVPLSKGLSKLQADPERFKEFNPSNGWGDYEGLVDFVREYLVACEQYPDAKVGVWR